jgi:hypothetical protein
VEVAQAAARHVYADRALLVFDLSRLETYYALHEIRDALCVFERCLSASEIWVVGNKRDVAIVDFEPDLSALGAQRYVAISALYDPPEVLVGLASPPRPRDDYRLPRHILHLQLPRLQRRGYVEVCEVAEDVLQ